VTTPAEAPPPDGAAALFTVMLTMAPEALEKALSAEPETAALLVRAAAEWGLAAGQVRLGRMYLQGAGAPANTHIAFAWFERAARQGDVDAWNMLGRCFENGWGVARDVAAAAHWFGRAAEAGDAWAQYNLAHLHLNGLGVDRDPARAVELYRAASEQDHARAMNLLGRCHEQGWGVQADLSLAALWYRRSAQGGYFRGQYNHASLLMAQGDRRRAMAWFEAAARTAPPQTRALILEACLDQWAIDLTAAVDEPA
jgi:TPR repeat protein